MIQERFRQSRVKSKLIQSEHCVMSRTALLTFLLGLMVAPATFAGHNGHYGGHGHHRYHYRGPRYSHHYRHNHHYAGLAAGLLFGSIVASANRPAVVQRRVIYRRSSQPQTVYQTAPAQPVVRGQPAPEQRPPYYYLKKADGSCHLIELTEDGSEIITPQSPEECG